MQFDATVGSEIQKTRPAVIVSNNVSNRYMPRVLVVPLTSNTGRIYPSEALVTVSGTQSKAMADQIATADKGRLKKILGKLSAQDMQAVDRAMRIQLGIPL